MADDPTVSDLGEYALIERVADRVGLAGAGDVLTGDDTAVLSSPGETLLFTTDALVEGVDFDLSYATGFDVGWKAIAANVSDVAAMGGRPRYATTALCTPGATPVAVLDELVQGLDAAARRWAVGLAGGDISTALEIVVSVALVGGVNRGQEVRRTGAQPGNAIYVTGTLGAAAGGLTALRAGLDDETLLPLAERHLRPSARVEEGERIRMAGASAMIDLSDGLAVDLWHLVTASEMGCEIDPALVPVDPGLGSLAELTEIDPRDLAIVGGEDFELLFTIDERLEETLQKSFEHAPIGITRIGTITDGDARIGNEPLESFKERGWEHLRDR